MADAIATTQARIVRAIVSRNSTLEERKRCLYRGLAGANAMVSLWYRLLSPDVALVRLNHLIDPFSCCGLSAVYQPIVNSLLRFPFTRKINLYPFPFQTLGISAT